MENTIKTRHAMATTQMEFLRKHQFYFPSAIEYVNEEIK